MSVSLTVDQFRADFPEFSNSTTYPNVTLTAYINRAYAFVSTASTQCFADEKRLLAIELMTAHLTTLGNAIAAGNTQGGLVGASSVGSVSVTLTPPVIKSQFQHWANQTAYGQQYLALLGAHTPAGLYMGGSLQRVFR
jgi:hypothetical protein